MKPRLPSNADLRGATRLATEATAGLADLVEAMHARIVRLPGQPATTEPGRTRGITGLVYKTVRGVTRLVGGSVDALLGLLSPALSADSQPPGPEREAVVAALNGVLGDHLVASANPLATPMQLRHQGRALPLEAAALHQALPSAGPRLLVLVHGLCMNDLQWQREGHDHGAALARELGFTPVYLHYNSGLHISHNGQAFAALLEQLLAVWPQPVQRLVLMGHSMGGLVARSAIHHAAIAGQRWPAHLNDLVCLGTPHHGAPLERAGHWVDVLLGATPYSAPLAKLTRVRSAGINDLHHGNLVEADWLGRDGSARRKDQRQHLPLPAGVRCFAVAGTVGTTAGDMKGRLLGDGLVPLASALGQHRQPGRTLAFDEAQRWVGEGINHMALLSRPEVYAQLLRWLG